MTAYPPAGLYLAAGYVYYPLPKTNFVFGNIKITNWLMWIFHGQHIFFFIFGEPRLCNCAASTRQP